MYFGSYGLPKDMVGSMRKKSRFRESVEKQHGKCPQTLFKCQRKTVYNIY